MGKRKKIIGVNGYDTSSELRKQLSNAVRSFNSALTRAQQKGKGSQISHVSVEGLMNEIENETYMKTVINQLRKGRKVSDFNIDQSTGATVYETKIFKEKVKHISNIVEKQREEATKELKQVIEKDKIISPDRFEELQRKKYAKKYNKEVTSPSQLRKYIFYQGEEKGRFLARGIGGRGKLSDSEFRERFIKETIEHYWEKNAKVSDFNLLNDFKEKLRSGKYDKEFREFLGSSYGASQFIISVSYFPGNLSDYILQYYHFTGMSIPKEYEEYYKDEKERYDNERNTFYEKKRLYE